MWPFRRKPKQAPPAPQPAPILEPAPASVLPSFLPNRREEICFSFVANYEQAIKYREELALLDPRMNRATVPVLPGDKLAFSYHIILEYFGNVARCLGIIQKLAEDRDLLVKVKIDELQHGRSLMVETLWALDDAIYHIQMEEDLTDD